jgi:LysR family hydrogen peroxide-inducible transcriptional activator
MELRLVEEKTNSLVDQLTSGRLDMALLARPVRSDSLTEHMLFEEDFVLAVPADHPLAASTGPVPASALVGEPVLLLDEGHCLRDQALSVCRLAGAAERAGFRATSLETLRQMVAAGVGVTLLPRLAVEAPVPASPDVTILRLADPAPRREIAAYWRRSDARAEWLAELADALAEVPAGLVTSPSGEAGWRT